jgi:hypothetical protein
MSGVLTRLLKRDHADIFSPSTGVGRGGVTLSLGGKGVCYSVAGRGGGVLQCHWEGRGRVTVSLEGVCVCYSVAGRGGGVTVSLEGEGCVLQCRWESVTGGGGVCTVSLEGEGGVTVSLEGKWTCYSVAGRGGAL